MGLVATTTMCLTICFSSCASLKTENIKSKVLFDGSTFDGWEGNMEYFRIEDGAVVAGNMNESIPRNEFLCTQMMYENFEMKVKAKLQGEGDNAGIQFRTHRIPDHHEVMGYQCDMGSVPGEKIWGYLYDESRRKKFLTTPDEEAMIKVLNADDWNDFVIRAEGNHIQIWLNGHKTVDFIEEDITAYRSGVICVQIHSGPPAEAWYKDIELTEL